MKRLSNMAVQALALIVAMTIVSSIEASAQEKPKVPKEPNPAFADVVDVADLPRVLLIGDSISIGYTVPVRDLLQGKANVHRPKTNNGPTTAGLRSIDEWLGNGSWDVIHFNWGLHDLKYMGPDGQNLTDPGDAKSHQQVPPEDYEKNLQQLVERLKKTGARLIWRNTTPVPEGASGRIVGDAAKYNAIAEKVMKQHGIEIHDLYSFVQTQQDKIMLPANVHFTKEGYVALGQDVARVILSALHVSERPNVIVFLTDDQGWGDLGCYGHPRIQSPYLDHFASEGLRLKQCYSACSVCSPSRSAILTGRTPYRNGVWRWIPEGSQYHLRTSEITLPNLLKDHGYDTCHAGKWHLNGLFNSDQQPQPDNHGYDHWLATQNNAAPNHLNPENFVRNREAVGRIEGPSSMICAKEALQWLESRKQSSNPFFLTLWTHEPHLPIESAEEYIKPYADIEDEGIRQHHGNITQMDAAFGHLIAGIDQLGYRDNTLVIFTADNGPEGDGLKGRTRGSTGGLRGRKRHSHEGGIRVPGIIRWPGHVAAGTESDTPVIGSDIFTTVCDIVGIPLPTDRTIDGASLVPLLDGKTIDRKQPLYWRNHLAPEAFRVAMRVDDWKIIGSDDLTKFELYNLHDDWQEKINVSATHPEKFADLRDKLIAYDASVLAEGPDWWKDEIDAEKKPANEKPNAGKKKQKTP